MRTLNKRRIVSAVFLLCCASATAQYAETIRADRPGQAIVPYTVGLGVLQLQSGVDGGWANAPYMTKDKAISANTTLRYGITRTFELNTSWEYRQGTTYTDSMQHDSRGLSGAAIGMRYNIVEAKNKRPAVGFQFSLNMPWMSRDYSQRNITPFFLLTAAESLTDKLTLTAIGGGKYIDNNAGPAGTYIVNLSYQAAPWLGVFAEGYGNVGRNLWEHRWDGGIAFIANNNLQLDAYGGGGYNQGLSEYFASIGVSYRIPPAGSKHQTGKTDKI